MEKDIKVEELNEADDMTTGNPDAEGYDSENREQI